MATSFGSCPTLSDESVRHMDSGVVRKVICYDMLHNKSQVLEVTIALSCYFLFTLLSCTRIVQDNVKRKPNKNLLYRENMTRFDNFLLGYFFFFSYSFLRERKTRRNSFGTNKKGLELIQFCHVMWGY